MRPSVGGEQGDDHERIPEAVARSYRQLRGSLRRSLTRRLNLSAAEFDELYQEAWQQVVRREREGEQIRNYRGFVIGVIVNQWKTRARANGRRSTVSLAGQQAEWEQRGGMGEPVAPPADEQLVRQEQVRLALELIESIDDPRRRQVLKLRLACGLSAREVQRVVGVSERTYRRLLEKAGHDLDLQYDLVKNGTWCADRREVLLAYAEGRADEHQAVQAKRHLDSCLACRQVVARWRRRSHRETRPLATASSGRRP
jgi:RNA polymerase sigma factor (sigma-70 family)